MKYIVQTSAAMMVAAAFSTVPAVAQDQAGDRVNQLVIYGDDPCPASSNGEIVVCARKEEAERYRIPETLRGGGLGEAKNQAWSQTGEILRVCREIRGPNLFRDRCFWFYWLYPKNAKPSLCRKRRR